MKTQYLPIIFLLTLSACGFHLRGAQQSTAVTVEKVYVSTQAAGKVATAVKLQLPGAGSRVVASAADAGLTLELEKEYFDRSVLSVSPTTGKVEEYQLTLSVAMSVTDANGKTLLADEEIRLTRDYTFDEGAVLGKGEEEQVLRTEMIAQAAAQILRRLKAVSNAK